MSIFHRLTGLECPNCKAPLAFSAISVLLGDEVVSVPLGKVKCSGCVIEIKAKGSRGDHFIRIFAAYVLPAFIVFHVWGEGFAFALNLVLLPFALKFVGLERA